MDGKDIANTDIAKRHGTGVVKRAEHVLHEGGRFISFALDVFKKYARIESKTVVVSVVEMNDSTTVLAPKIDSNFHNKKFKIAPIKIKKRVDAKKILFFSDGAVEFVH